MTDGLHSYRKAIGREFPQAQHIKADGITSHEKNNNMIERFHNTFRERDKVMRGFKGQKNASIMAESFRTYYNFVRPNMALQGRTPSRVARIQAEIGRNRWMKLLA